MTPECFFLSYVPPGATPYCTFQKCVVNVTEYQVNCDRCKRYINKNKARDILIDYILKDLKEH